MDGGLGERARKECLGGDFHGRRIGGRVLLGSMRGTDHEEGSACNRDEWCALAGDSNTSDKLVIENV